MKNAYINANRIARIIAITVAAVMLPVLVCALDPGSRLSLSSYATDYVEGVETDNTITVPVKINGKEKIEVTAETADAPMPDPSVIEIDGEGTIVIPFNTIGDFEYKVRQKIENPDSLVTYDDTVWTLRVNVVDRGDGYLRAAVTAQKGDNSEKPGRIEFINRKGEEPVPDKPVPEEPLPTPPKPVIVDPPLRKIVEGDDPENLGKFTFAMQAASNTAGYEVKDMPMVAGSVAGRATKTVTGPGEYEFGEILIVKAGTYRYEMVEVDNKEEGYSYDTVRYYIEWIATEADGKLSAQMNITDEDGKRLNICEFVNKYTKKTSVPEKIIRKITPNTGDPATILLWVAVLAAGAFGYAAVRRRRGA